MGPGCQRLYRRILHYAYAPSHINDSNHSKFVIVSLYVFGAEADGTHIFPYLHQELSGTALSAIGGETTLTFARALVPSDTKLARLLQWYCVRV